jgi:hypothetical protein
MKEVEKAKKEAAKFKTKREKEKEKGKDEQKDEDTVPDESMIDPPERNSRPYSYKPPPPYTLHSAPSVSQLVYQPPSLERFNSVRKSSNAVTSLAMSLEPARTPGDCGVPTPPTSPPDNRPHGAYTSYTAYTPPQPPPQSPTYNASRSENSRSGEDVPPVEHMKNARPDFTGKRVFSDPGPERSRTAPNEHLNPGVMPRERSRSPYGFSRVPQEEVPNVERKRPSFQSPPQPASSGRTSYRNFSTPASGKSKIGSVPEEQEPASSGPRTSPTSPTTGSQKPSNTYHPPPPPRPPQSPSYPGANETNVPPQPESAPEIPKRPDNVPRQPAIPPPPPPRHGTIYVVLTPYLTHEIGHISLVPFDTLVDVSPYTPEEDSLPYPTAFDTTPKHYWQASLGNRRGPRGLFPHDTVCAIDDEKVTQRLGEAWFADKEVGFIADGQGRCWVGPNWEWREPSRRRSKWWAEEF